MSGMMPTSVVRRRGSPGLFAIGLLAFLLADLDAARSQEAPPGEASEAAAADASTVVEPPAEYLGSGQPRVQPETLKDLAGADAAIGKEEWKEAAALLDRLLGPAPRTAAGPAVDREGDPCVTADGVLFAPAAVEARRRTEKLPPAGLAALRERRGETAGPAAGSAVPPERPPGSASDWLCLSGRPDHRAPVLAPEAEWKPGGYARWIHRLTNERKLESSQPARNFYYAYFPMQAVSFEGLILARSHQDIVALDRVTGQVRWRVDSDIPVADQTIHKSASRYNSWFYFSDIGGWALTVVPGQPARVLVTSITGRGTVTGGKVQFLRNELRAYDARKGTLDWRRGGPEDRDEILRELTFAAPPTPCGPGDDLLVAPATSDEGYYAVALTPKGELVWAKKVYSYDPTRAELLDENLGFGASLATSDGLVAGAPGHGLVFALTPKGETLWLTRYPSAVRQTVNDPRWAPCHPIIAGDRVIAAPFDGDSLLALDAKTGAPVWTKRLLSGYYCLIGADERRAYFIGVDGRVTALALADGTTVWATEPLGAPAGRPLVTSNRLYVGLARTVAILDTATGAVQRRCPLWDERLPDPCPGNLLLFGDELALACSWGYARLEPYEATIEGLGSLGAREQHLRKARLAQVGGRYGEALEELKAVLAATSDETQREALRAELVQVSQEAASTTRDVDFIRRLLAEPELIPTKAHRTSFVLRSAELFEKQAPEEAARLYREAIADFNAGDLVPSPDGVLVDVGLHASDALRDLIIAGKAAPLPAEEEKVKGAVADALGSNAISSEGRRRRLSMLALRFPHVLSSAAASAHLARAAEEGGDAAAALAHLERLVGDNPGLLGREEIRARIHGLRATVSGDAGPAPAGFAARGPWERRFFGKLDGAELFSSAEGSSPIPGILILKDATAALLDSQGKVIWKQELAAVGDLASARTRIQGTLVEPAQVFARDDRLLVFTATGLLELVGGESGPPRAVRSWLKLEHPLKPHAAPSPGPAARTTAVRKAVVGGVVTTTTPAPAPANVKVNDNSNFYARISFDPAGNPRVVQPGGTVTAFERKTGRLTFKWDGRDETSAGAPSPAGNVLSVESSKPPGLVIHDMRQHTRHVIPAPATPWRGIVVPGMAAVIDTSAGLQVRELPALEPEAGEEAARTWWRDAKPRGFACLVHADATGVIAVEQGGALTRRSLRSGRLRWSLPFPEAASPVRVFELPAASRPGDLLILACRGVDPEDGRGVLGDRVAQDLFALRVSLSGEKRWEARLAEGAVACDGSRIIAGSGTWVIAFNHKVKEWKTRAVALDLEKGSASDLFELDLPARPNYPPPSLLWTVDGIAVGNFGRWALFAPPGGSARSEEKQP